MRRFPRWRISVLIPVALISAICANAQEQRESLRGLSGVSVSFQIDPKLDAARVRDDLRARLEGAGIPMLQKAAGVPVLSLIVGVTSMSDEIGVLYIRLDLKQDVLLARRPSQHTIVATWSADLAAADGGDRDRARASVNSLFEEFIADYKSVNPK
jgi:hypothetical protein